MEAEEGEGVIVFDGIWLRHGQPLPEGYRLAEQELTHHHNHAILIEKIDAGE